MSEEHTLKKNVRKLTNKTDPTILIKYFNKGLPKYKSDIVYLVLINRWTGEQILRRKRAPGKGENTQNPVSTCVFSLRAMTENYRQATYFSSYESLHAFFFMVKKKKKVV